MKYFLDTKKYEKPNSIDLISVGIVSENGDTFYAEHSRCNKNEIEKDEWTVKNVLTGLAYWDRDKTPSGEIFINNKDDLIHYSIFGSLSNIRDSLMTWLAKLGEIHPEFYGYYCAQDWVAFCWIFGKMKDLPQFFPMYCRDLKQTLDELNIRKALDSNYHSCNALDNALEIMDLYYHIEDTMKEDMDFALKYDGG